jgi:hypothetical protein
MKISGKTLVCGQLEVCRRRAEKWFVRSPQATAVPDARQRQLRALARGDLKPNGADASLSQTSFSKTNEE